MKRFLALVLCALLLTASLSACSDGGTDVSSAPVSEPVSEPSSEQISEPVSEEESSADQQGTSTSALARVEELNALLEDPLPEHFVMNNVAAGCEYTYSREPHNSFPDKGGALTDDNICGTESEDWVGFIGRNDIGVTLDLGGLKNDLCGVSINLLHNESTGRNIPKTCQFWVSSDGENFTLLGTSARYPAVFNGKQVFVHAYYSQKTFSAAYVRVVLTDFISLWTYIDSLCVYDIHGVVNADTGEEDYYENDPLPLVTEELYWDDAEDNGKTVNLIRGLGQRIYSSVRISEDLALPYYNAPASSRLLTDGARAKSSSYSDDAYFHMTRCTARQIVYDLGKISAVSSATAGFYAARLAGVYPPDRVSVLVSENGADWQTVASLGSEAYPKFSGSRGDITLDFGKVYRARFVKFNIELSSHVWMDELEVFGTKSIPDGAVSPVADPVGSALDSFNDPADIGGSENILLAYTFIPNDPPAGHVPKEKYIPYVGYLDKDGSITDTFFDSFLFLPCVRTLASGAHLFSSSEIPSVMSDWVQYQNDVFWEDSNINALEQAAGEVKTALGGETEKLKVFFTILNPHKKATSFGDVDGDGKSEDMTKIEDRKKVIKWWIDSYIERFNAAGFENLEINGFYWYDESVGVSDKLVRETLAYAVEYVHSLGHYIIWIPYHQASGFQSWKEFGFDAANMQPNYMFHAENTVQVVYTNAELCARYGMGVEIEMDGTALSDPEYHKRYVEYLSIGAERGYMNGVKMYYQDGCPGLLYRCVKSGNARNRLLYDLTYKYAKRQLSPTLGTIEGNVINISQDTFYDGKVFAGGVECTDLSVAVSPNYGAVAFSQAGDLRYVPIEGYVGEDTFVLNVSDGFSTAKVVFTVTVTPADPESDG